MSVYKKLNNVKLYNRNGERIDSFGGDGENNGSSSPQNDYVQRSELAEVAFTGAYDDLYDNPVYNTCGIGIISVISSSEVDLRLGNSVTLNGSLIDTIFVVFREPSIISNPRLMYCYLYDSANNSSFSGIYIRINTKEAPEIGKPYVLHKMLSKINNKACYQLVDLDYNFQFVQQFWRYKGYGASYDTESLSIIIPFGIDRDAYNISFLCYIQENLSAINSVAIYDSYHDSAKVVASTDIHINATSLYNINGNISKGWYICNIENQNNSTYMYLYNFNNIYTFE